MPKRELKVLVKWLPRRWPYFAIGIDLGEFRLCLWIVEIEVWRSY
jgi:hypothetical protein